MAIVHSFGKEAVVKVTVSACGEAIATDRWEEKLRAAAAEQSVAFEKVKFAMAYSPQRKCTPMSIEFTQRTWPAKRAIECVRGSGVRRIC
jgi:hypothetical protein